MDHNELAQKVNEDLVTDREFIESATAERERLNTEIKAARQRIATNERLARSLAPPKTREKKVQEAADVLDPEALAALASTAPAARAAPAFNPDPA